MPRPPKERRITVSVTDDMYEYLASKSEQSDLPVASVVRRMLQAWIDENMQPAAPLQTDGSPLP